MAETFNITLNMDKTKRQPAAIAARVGDVDSISVVAQLYNGTEPYTPVGTSAYFECVCPNGYAVRQTASVSGTTVSATLVPEVFQAPGVINDAYFRFENGASTDPTYVESTESFVILVYSSVDDNVEAGDYIAEWRQSQGVLDEAADVAASALPTIKSAVSSVEQAASGAITDINEAKADVEAAAGDVMKPINDAIGEMNKTVEGALNDFNTDAQAELSAFDTNASNKINQFETNASSKLSEYDSDVTAFISSAQSSVNTNIEELDDATQQAIDAMESALSDDPYGDLLQRISRDWKLTLRDMVTLSGSVDLNLMNVGTFALSPSGATISNAPVTDNTPFILFSGQYFETMKYQLALYPSAETQIYIRYQTGTGSGSNVVWGAWSSWSPISGGGSSITTPVSIADGGTGATTASQARSNLGIQPGVVAGTAGRLSQSGIDLEQVLLSNLFGGNSYQFLATTTSSAGVSVTAGTSAFASSVAMQALPPLGVDSGGVTSRAIVQDGTTDMASVSMETHSVPGDAPLPVIALKRSTGTLNAGAEFGIDAQYSSYVGTTEEPIDNIHADKVVLGTPLPISSGGTGAASAAQARANIGAGTSNFSGDYNDLKNKPTIPTVPSFPLSIANGGTGATTAEQARANLGITSGGGSGGMSIKLYDKADLNFVFPNTSSYTLINYYNGTIPFSGFVMNGTYEFTGSCVIFSMMLTRKMITNPGYPYLYLTSQTMDNSTATATFDSNHGFNLFGNMSTNSVSSLHPFPYIGSAGRDFWNCGYIIGRIHQSPPTGSSITLSSGTLCILPFSLRFNTDGWCKMLLNCQANNYLNDYLTIDSLLIPPLNIGVGGSALS